MPVSSKTPFCLKCEVELCEEATMHSILLIYRCVACGQRYAAIHNETGLQIVKLEEPFDGFHNPPDDGGIKYKKRL